MNKRCVTVVATTVMAVGLLSGLTQGESQLMEATVTPEETVTAPMETVPKSAPIAVVEKPAEVATWVADPTQPTYQLLVRGEANQTVEVTQGGLLVTSAVTDDRGEAVVGLQPGVYTATDETKSIAFTFRDNASLVYLDEGACDAEILIMSQS